MTGRGKMKELWRESVSPNATKCGSDREFLKQFQEARMRLAKLGFALPEFRLVDQLYSGLTRPYKDLIQTKIEQKRTRKV